MGYRLLVLFSLITSLIWGQDNRSAEKLSVEQYLQLAAKNKEAGDFKETTRYLNEAAIVVWENKDYTKAIDYFTQSIELNQLINNYSGVSKLNSNLAMIYSDLGQYEQSLHYFQLSLDYRLLHG
jgi:tetratricopeptide (TPR) repeat protein